MLVSAVSEAEAKKNGGQIRPIEAKLTQRCVNTLVVNLWNLCAAKNTGYGKHGGMDEPVKAHILGFMGDEPPAKIHAGFSAARLGAMRENYEREIVTEIINFIAPQCDRIAKRGGRGVRVRYGVMLDAIRIKKGQRAADALDPSCIVTKIIVCHPLPSRQSTTGSFIGGPCFSFSVVKVNPRMGTNEDLLDNESSDDELAQHRLQGAQGRERLRSSQLRRNLLDRAAEGGNIKDVAVGAGATANRSPFKAAGSLGGAAAAAAGAPVLVHHSEAVAVVLVGNGLNRRGAIGRAQGIGCLDVKPLEVRKKHPLPHFQRRHVLQTGENKRNGFFRGSGRGSFAASERQRTSRDPDAVKFITTNSLTPYDDYDFGGPPQTPGSTDSEQLDYAMDRSGVTILNSSGAGNRRSTSIEAPVRATESDAARGSGAALPESSDPAAGPGVEAARSGGRWKPHSNLNTLTTADRAFPLRSVQQHNMNDSVEFHNQSMSIDGYGTAYSYNSDADLLSDTSVENDVGSFESLEQGGLTSTNFLSYDDMVPLQHKYLHANGNVYTRTSDAVGQAQASGDQQQHALHTANTTFIFHSTGQAMASDQLQQTGAPYVDVGNAPLSLNPSVLKGKLSKKRTTITNGNAVNPAFKLAANSSSSLWTKKANMAQQGPLMLALGPAHAFEKAAQPGTSPRAAAGSTSNNQKQGSTGPGGTLSRSTKRRASKILDHVAQKQLTESVLEDGHFVGGSSLMLSSVEMDHEGESRSLNSTSYMTQHSSVWLGPRVSSQDRSPTHTEKAYELHLQLGGRKHKTGALGGGSFEKGSRSRGGKDNSRAASPNSIVENKIRMKKLNDGENMLLADMIQVSSPRPADYAFLKKNPLVSPTNVAAAMGSELMRGRERFMREQRRGTRPTNTGAAVVGALSHKLLSGKIGAGGDASDADKKKWNASLERGFENLTRQVLLNHEEEARGSAMLEKLEEKVSVLLQKCLQYHGSLTRDEVNKIRRAFVNTLLRIPRKPQHPAGPAEKLDADLQKDFQLTGNSFFGDQKRGRGDRVGGHRGAGASPDGRGRGRALLSPMLPMRRPDSRAGTPGAVGNIWRRLLFEAKRKYVEWRRGGDISMAVVGSNSSTTLDRVNNLSSTLSVTGAIPEEGTTSTAGVERTEGPKSRNAIRNKALSRSTLESVEEKPRSAPRGLSSAEQILDGASPEKTVADATLVEKIDFSNPLIEDFFYRKLVRAFRGTPSSSTLHQSMSLSTTSLEQQVDPALAGANPEMENLQPPPKEEAFLLYLQCLKNHPEISLREFKEQIEAEYWEWHFGEPDDYYNHSYSIFMPGDGVEPVCSTSVLTSTGPPQAVEHEKQSVTYAEGFNKMPSKINPAEESSFTTSVPVRDDATAIAIAKEIHGVVEVEEDDDEGPCTRTKPSSALHSRGRSNSGSCSSPKLQSRGWHRVDGCGTSDGGTSSVAQTPGGYFRYQHDVLNIPGALAVPGGSGTGVLNGLGSAPTTTTSWTTSRVQTPLYTTMHGAFHPDAAASSPSNKAGVIRQKVHGRAGADRAADAGAGPDGTAAAPSKGLRSHGHAATINASMNVVNEARKAAIDKREANNKMISNYAKNAGSGNSAVEKFVPKPGLQPRKNAKIAATSGNVAGVQQGAAARVVMSLAAPSVSNSSQELAVKSHGPVLRGVKRRYGKSKAAGGKSSSSAVELAAEAATNLCRKFQEAAEKVLDESNAAAQQQEEQAGRDEQAQATAVAINGGDVEVVASFGQIGQAGEMGATSVEGHAQDGAGFPQSFDEAATVPSVGVRPEDDKATETSASAAGTHEEEPATATTENEKEAAHDHATGHEDNTKDNCSTAEEPVPPPASLRADTDTDEMKTCDELDVDQYVADKKNLQPVTTDTAGEDTCEDEEGEDITSTLAGEQTMSGTESITGVGSGSASSAVGSATEVELVKITEVEDKDENGVAVDDNDIDEETAAATRDEQPAKTDGNAATSALDDAEVTGSKESDGKQGNPTTSDASPVPPSSRKVAARKAATQTKTAMHWASAEKNIHLKKKQWQISTVKKNATSKQEHDFFAEMSLQAQENLKELDGAASSPSSRQQSREVFFPAWGHAGFWKRRQLALESGQVTRKLVKELEKMSNMMEGEQLSGGRSASANRNGSLAADGTSGASDSTTSALNPMLQTSTGFIQEFGRAKARQQRSTSHKTDEGNGEDDWARVSETMGFYQPRKKGSSPGVQDEDCIFPSRGRRRSDTDGERPLSPFMESIVWMLEATRARGAPESGGSASAGAGPSREDLEMLRRYSKELQDGGESSRYAGKNLLAFLRTQTPASRGSRNTPGSVHRRGSARELQDADHYNNDERGIASVLHGDPMLNLGSAEAYRPSTVPAALDLRKPKEDVLHAIDEHQVKQLSQDVDLRESIQTTLEELEREKREHEKFMNGELSRESLGITSGCSSQELIENSVASVEAGSTSEEEVVPGPTSTSHQDSVMSSDAAGLLPVDDLNREIIVGNQDDDAAGVAKKRKKRSRADKNKRSVASGSGHPAPSFDVFYNSVPVKETSQFVASGNFLPADPAGVFWTVHIRDLSEYDVTSEIAYTTPPMSAFHFQRSAAAQNGLQGGCAGSGGSRYGGGSTYGGGSGYSSMRNTGNGWYSDAGSYEWHHGDAMTDRGSVLSAGGSLDDSKLASRAGGTGDLYGSKRTLLGPNMKSSSSQSMILKNREQAGVMSKEFARLQPHERRELLQLQQAMQQQRVKTPSQWTAKERRDYLIEKQKLTNPDAFVFSKQKLSGSCGKKLSDLVFDPREMKKEKDTMRKPLLSLSKAGKSGNKRSTGKNGSPEKATCFAFAPTASVLTSVSTLEMDKIVEDDQEMSLQLGEESTMLLSGTSRGPLADDSSSTTLHLGAAEPGLHRDDGMAITQNSFYDSSMEMMIQQPAYDHRNFSSPTKGNHSSAGGGAAPSPEKPHHRGPKLVKYSGAPITSEMEPALLALEHQKMGLSGKHAQAQLMPLYKTSPTKDRRRNTSSVGWFSESFTGLRGREQSSKDQALRNRSRSPKMSLSLSPRGSRHTAHVTDFLAHDKNEVIFHNTASNFRPVSGGWGVNDGSYLTARTNGEQLARNMGKRGPNPGAADANPVLWGFF
eukprot:g1626.t1